ncbi:hypothetical protein F4821DRAFT_231022 [Hypoxylon rubiginosum]|uniref:Uncharacterized protein n=1 Tax=Hypoxylon rubiginosum TaxID=110542 RepID=A0ACC0D9L2_9PEZI|nr:hypothetical protein F4821DRAFT_231022 [Hypoxylon rubiginosum]
MSQGIHQALMLSVSMVVCCCDGLDPSGRISLRNEERPASRLGIASARYCGIDSPNTHANMKRYNEGELWNPFQQRLTSWDILIFGSMPLRVVGPLETLISISYIVHKLKMEYVVLRFGSRI